MTCSRAGARHDMRDAVPPCGTTGGGGGAGTSPAAARATPDARTADPAAPDPPTHPEATRADRHHDLHAPRLQNPLNNIPGVWCSLTARAGDLARWAQMSQCTYRCVVLPDTELWSRDTPSQMVSMHLQVRGAP